MLTEPIFPLNSYLKSYISPKLIVHYQSKKGGFGVFCLEPVVKGELLAIFGGHALNYQQLMRLPDYFHSLTLQVKNDLYLVSFRVEPADRINHSCNPNAGMSQANHLVAIKNIEARKEICFDYAMTDSCPYDEFICHCGESQCRGKVTGNDWRSPELQARYKDYFSPYLRHQIKQEQNVTLKHDRKHLFSHV